MMSRVGRGGMMSRVGREDKRAVRAAHEEVIRDQRHNVDGKPPLEIPPRGFDPIEIKLALRIHPALAKCQTESSAHICHRMLVAEVSV